MQARRSVPAVQDGLVVKRSMRVNRNTTTDADMIPTDEAVIQAENDRDAGVSGLAGAGVASKDLYDDSGKGGRDRSQGYNNGSSGSGYPRQGSRREDDYDTVSARLGGVGGGQGISGDKRRRNMGGVAEQGGAGAIAGAMRNNARIEEVSRTQAEPAASDMIASCHSFLVVQDLGDGLETQENGEQDNKLYCLCKQRSYGEMIGCDNERDCPIEWFHLDCVSLTPQTRPKGKWFCPKCRWYDSEDDLAGDYTRMGKGQNRLRGQLSAVNRRLSSGGGAGSLGAAAAAAAGVGGQQSRKLTTSIRSSAIPAQSSSSGGNMQGEKQTTTPRTQSMLCKQIGYFVRMSFAIFLTAKLRYVMCSNFDAGRRPGNGGGGGGGGSSSGGQAGSKRMRA
jgi:hypothetical protein